jgi:hypothetical protein
MSAAEIVAMGCGWLPRQGHGKEGVSGITLSATNSRDVIWSGACSSGGNKTKTCTFTLTGNAAVTANVQ